jgi:GR25 family glycosyltransferase involved in LPS biosynthesis
MNTISDIQHTLYINLDSRVDRKEHVENQLQTIGIKNAERFKAVEMKSGAVGCTLSHIKCLEYAKAERWEHVLIVEDDILFLNPFIFMKSFNHFLSNHKNFDVVLVAGNNIPPYKQIDESCIKVTKCQTTTGYFVQRHYYDTLIQNYREGINLLMKYPDQGVQFAIDKYWFRLQGIHNWYLITPLTVTQKEGYSDIEERNTNYNHLMLDLNKEWLFKHTDLNWKYK